MSSSRGEIDELISASLPPLELIPRLGPYITGPHADTAFIALSQSLTDHQSLITDHLRHNLISFIQSVFEFRQHLSPGLATLVEAIFHLGTVPDLPLGLSLLSCEPARRRSFLNGLRSGLGREVKVSQIPAILSLIEDETDPLALLAAFRLITDVSIRIHGDLGEIEAESVFDHCSVYFPITYNGSACDPDLLRSTLLTSLTCRQEMAPFALPFFMDKLRSSMNQAQLQSLDALCRCMQVFPLLHTSRYLLELSRCLTEIWSDPSSSPSTIQMSIKLLSSILLFYFSTDTDDVTDTDITSCRDQFLEPILSIISKRLQSSVPVRSSSAYVQALAALCSSSSHTFQQSYQTIWPILMQRMISSKDANERTMSALIVGDTFIKGLTAEHASPDLVMKSIAIIDTLISIADPSSPSDLLRSVISSLSECVTVLSSDITRLDSLIKLASMTVQHSVLGHDGRDPIIPNDTIDAAFKILEQISIYYVDAVVQATFSDFMSQPEHLERICIGSRSYLRAVLPLLNDARTDDRSVTRLLCNIAKQCSDDCVECFLSMLGSDIDGDEEADLFQSIYSRCSADQQLQLCHKYMMSDGDYINDRLTTICILNRHPETVLSDEIRILQSALESAAQCENPTACLIVADILNKSQDLHTIHHFLHSPAYFSIDLSAAHNSSLLMWIARALASRGESAGFQLAADLLQFPCHLSKLHILSDDRLPLVYWRILPLYRQRLLCTLLPVMLENQSCLEYLPQLLAGAPHQALVDFTQRLLPVLQQSLSTTSSAADLSLSSLIILISSNPSCISSRIGSFIEPLLSLLSPGHNAKVRVQALQLLSLIVENIAAHEVYPYKPRIRQALISSLDDKKRICRQAARHCLLLTAWQ